MYDYLNILGYDIFIDSLSLINLDLKHKFIISTINPHSYITAQKDTYFRSALLNSDLLLPDGSGIVFAAKFIKNINIPKISGYDLHQYLISELNSVGGRVFYLGASDDTLIKIKNRLGVDYPNLIVELYSPPFSDNFSEEDNYLILDKINNFKPDILFVGMSAPKQEKWLEKNKAKIDFKVAASIGAVFDFYAGTVFRPNDFWIKYHLEWLVRFIREPKRLWERNLISTPLFLKELILTKYGKC